MMNHRKFLLTFQSSCIARQMDDISVIFSLTIPITSLDGSKLLRSWIIVESAT